MRLTFASSGLRTSAFTVSATSALGVVQASQTNDSSLLKLAADIEQVCCSPSLLSFPARTCRSLASILSGSILDPDD
jgi:hypothetical protein